MSRPVDVRPLTSTDLDWVVEVTRLRREALQPVAPRFWRPSVDATAVHRRFLDGLINDDETVGLRTDHGYLIAQPQGPVWVVDDMVVAPDEAWPHEGVELLRHAQERCGPLRLVVPAVETSRMAAARVVGLELVEIWWHKNLPLGGDRVAEDQIESTLGDPVLLVLEAKGRLVAAPPIYDPGGPVLLVTAVDSSDGLTRIEAEAVDHGAPVSVVTQKANDERLKALLTNAGYTRTTYFCESAAGSS
jgi:hypothetical protein